jgi:hypothetical protein
VAVVARVQTHQLHLTVVLQVVETEAMVHQHRVVVEDLAVLLLLLVVFLMFIQEVRVVVLLQQVGE